MKVFLGVLAVIGLPSFFVMTTFNSKILDEQDISESISLEEGDTIYRDLMYNNSSFDETNFMGYYSLDCTYVQIKFDGTPLIYKFKAKDWSASFFTCGTQLYALENDGYLTKLKLDGSNEFILNLNEHPVLRENGLIVGELLGHSNNARSLSENEILIPLLWDFNSKNKKYSNYKKSCPTFGVYNLTSGNVRLLSVPRKPKQKKPYYYDAYQIGATVTGDSLLVAYAFENEVRVYNWKKNEFLGSRKVVSTEMHEDRPQIKRKQLYDSDFTERHHIESSSFGPIVYNKYRDEFYRIYYLPLPRKNEKGEFTIYTDKRVLILVLNRDLEVTKEIRCIEGRCHIFGLTPTKEGFIINDLIGSRAGKLRLNHVKIN